MHKRRNAVLPLPLGIYRHYKGNKSEVIGFAMHSETNEDMVLYKALNDDVKTWVRLLSMWVNKPILWYAFFGKYI